MDLIHKIDVYRKASTMHLEAMDWDLYLLQDMSTCFAPEFYHLSKIDYSIRGCIDFNNINHRRRNAKPLRIRAFSSLLAATRKQFSFKSSYFAYYSIEEFGESGCNPHFHFGIAKHPAFSGKEEEIANCMASKWRDGVPMKNPTTWVDGKCKIEPFDNSEGVKGILYDCKREYQTEFDKEPYINPRLKTKLMNF